MATIQVVDAEPEITTEEPSLDSGNTAWMLTATALVLFMTLPGLALFYGGLVQSKNVLSVLMHCFAIACLASIIWFAVGYSLALTLEDWETNHADGLVELSISSFNYLVRIH